MLLRPLLGLCSAFLNLQNTKYTDKSVFPFSCNRTVQIQNVKLLFSCGHLMKTPKHSLFLKTPKFIPKTTPITWNYVSWYVQPISQCSAQLPADTSITYLHLSISLPCFEPRFRSSCLPSALSLPSPSNLCAVTSKPHAAPLLQIQQWLHNANWISEVKSSHWHWFL